MAVPLRLWSLVSTLGKLAECTGERNSLTTGTLGPGDVVGTLRSVELNAAKYDRLESIFGVVTEAIFQRNPVRCSHRL